MKSLILCFTLLIAGNNPYPSKNSDQMEKGKIVEMVLFNLKDGVKITEGKQAMLQLQAFVEKQPGFISRKTSVASDGQFLDLVYWTDLASAQAASENAMKTESLIPSFSVMDQHTMVFKHFEIFN